MKALFLVFFLSLSAYATDVQTLVEQQAIEMQKTQKLLPVHWEDLKSKARKLRVEQLHKAEQIINDLEAGHLSERERVDFLLTHMISSLDKNWGQIKERIGNDLVYELYGIDNGTESTQYFVREELKSFLHELKMSLNDGTVSSSKVKEEMFELSHQFYSSLESLEVIAENMALNPDINTSLDRVNFVGGMMGLPSIGLMVYSLASIVINQDLSSAIPAFFASMAFDVGKKFVNKKVVNPTEQEVLRRWQAFLHLANHYFALEILGEATTAFYLMKMRESGVEGCFDKLVNTNQVREEVKTLRRSITVEF